ncbi:MAG: geopeptide radical SAM maturase [Desulfobulbaceae bacterium]|nr:geopeptide radical SAM maturase [Desulfobulbaceae bacterium]
MRAPLYNLSLASPMILSRYRKEFPHPTDPDITLLFSTRTTALVMLDKETLALLKRGEELEGSEALVDCGLLVADHAQEKAEVLDYLNEMNRQHVRLSVAVVLGMRCNFTCTYCYEGEKKGSFDMEQATMERLPAFLMEQTRPKTKRIALDFYGGEPLLYVETIKTISQQMQRLCAEAGLTYDFALVSNGSLLRPELIKELKEYGLDTIRLTVDGPAELHNQSRPFRGGAPSFATIVKNIRDCTGLVNITMGGNYTKENYRQFPQLFSELQDAKLGPEHFAKLRFSPVIQPENKKLSPLGFHSGCQSVSEKWLPEAAIFLQDQLSANGYEQQSITPTPCMVDRDDTFTIHYDGNLYHCPALVGQEELICGNIDEGFKDYHTQYDLQNWRKHDKCHDCIYLILCFGGCRFMKYRKDHTMDIDCKKSFLDATLEAFIQQDIKAQM